MTFEIEVKTIRKMCFLITAFILCSLLFVFHREHAILKKTKPRLFD